MLNYYRPQGALLDVAEAPFCASSPVHHMTSLQDYVKWASSCESLLLLAELGSW